MNLYAIRIFFLQGLTFFRSMFNKQWKESDDSSVEIDDLTGDAVGEMLLYMYTGEMKSKDAWELLKAADKYVFTDLKKWCELKIMEEINADNVVEILLLADTHSAETLRKAVVSYVAHDLK